MIFISNWLESLSKQSKNVPLYKVQQLYNFYHSKILRIFQI